MLLAAALACTCFASCGGNEGEASPVDVVRKFVESKSTIPYEEFHEEMGKGVPKNLEGVEFELLERASDRAAVGVTFP